MKKLPKLLVCSIIFISSSLFAEIVIADSNSEETKPVYDAVEIAAQIQNQVKFIERFYLNVLGRAADQEGLSHWLKEMQSTSGASVALGFFKSEEYLGLQLNDSQFIDMLYATLFDRQADAGGHKYWMAELEAGKLRDAIISGFLRSLEFQALADKFGVVAFDEDSDKLLQIKSFIQRFYQLVLDREADEGGLDYWSSKLTSGTETGGEVATGFLNSTEFLNRNIGDSEFANILYRSFFDREADQDGKDYWMAQLARGGSRQSVIDGFIDSREFIELAARFGILASREKFTAEMIQNKTFYFVHKDEIKRSVGIFQESTYEAIKQDESSQTSYSGSFTIDDKGSLVLDDGRSILTIVSAPNADYLQIAEVESDDGFVNNLRMYYDENKAIEYYNLLVIQNPGSQGNEIACTSANFTSKILSSIQSGMSIAQVNETIGCSLDSGATQVFSSEGFVTYQWSTIQDGFKFIMVFFDAEGVYATPFADSLLTQKYGF